MSCKAGLYTVNTNAQALTIGSAISPGSIVRRFGQNVNLNNDSIVISGAGYYDVSAAVTITATTAGTVTVSLTKDDSVVPGAVASSLVAQGDIVTVPINALVREFGCCCDNTSNLKFVVGGAGETISNIAIVVERI